MSSGNSTSIAASTPPPERRRSSIGSSSSNTTSRLESFTEAVPLALSSFAHASVFSDSAGVLDGIRQVIQHALLQCVNYARMIVPRHDDDNAVDDWIVRDLGTSQYAWKPVKEEMTTANSGSTTLQQSLDQEIPLPLAKMKFQHCYSRNALIYLNQSETTDASSNDSFQDELARLRDWTSHDDILGRITLLYATTEPLTRGELDGTERDDDMPACILYKVLVEYRTLPPTGNRHARLAEELSMLSFGGSVDDAVKYGALASLYDAHAKYVTEIYSVRGRKYKLDVMDATLSDGTTALAAANAKSLCVTVTDHALYATNTMSHDGGATDKNKAAEKFNADATTKTKPKFAITRMSLLLEGKPRKGDDFSSLPGFDDIRDGITDSFLLLNPTPTATVAATPSGHALLLDPSQAGRVYVNGCYVTTWGSDARIGAHGVALFGMDLHSIPVWHGRIVDYDALKAAYAALWDEVLVDARLAERNIGAVLLYRLLLGRDREEDEELYDDDDNMLDDSNVENGAVDANVDCLESQVLSSSHFDSVGIAAKALATIFAAEFGSEAFPCAPHEAQWVRSKLPHRKTVAAPERLIRILRRGGYFDAQRTAEELWSTGSRPPKGPEQDCVNAALQLLEQAGCDDVALEQICMTSFATTGDSLIQKMVCCYNSSEQTYYVHDKLLDISVNDYIDNENQAATEPAKVKAFLLGMFLAKEHPDGRILPRYLLRVSL